jgi:hypothetical protein
VGAAVNPSLALAASFATSFCLGGCVLLGQLTSYPRSADWARELPQQSAAFERSAAEWKAMGRPDPHLTLHARHEARPAPGSDPRVLGAAGEPEAIDNFAQRLRHSRMMLATRATSSGGRVFLHAGDTKSGAVPDRLILKAEARLAVVTGPSPAHAQTDRSEVAAPQHI